MLWMLILYAGTCLSETSEGRQSAEAACDWSATSRASLIKRLISGKIVLMQVSKLKANTEHLLQCFFVALMTFKAYVTADINIELTYVSFHKLG